jgi:hypothetical protein
MSANSEAWGQQATHCSDLCPGCRAVAVTHHASVARSQGGDHHQWWWTLGLRTRPWDGEDAMNSVEHAEFATQETMTSQRRYVFNYNEDVVYKESVPSGQAEKVNSYADVLKRLKENVECKACKIWCFHGGDYEECRLLWYIEYQFVLHRRHITSPLQSPAS